MPDVLLQTLFWTGNPVFVYTDLNGTGGAQVRAITAAESHDASDATYEGGNVSGDGSGTDGLLDALASKAVTVATAPGTLSFIRFKTRARVTGAGSSATWQPVVGGGPTGASPALTGAFADYSQDVATNPSTGLAWTNATINATTFGVDFRISEPDANFPTAAQMRASEWSLEIWGPNAWVVKPTAPVPMSLGVLEPSTLKSVGYPFNRVSV